LELFETGIGILGITDTILTNHTEVIALTIQLSGKIGIPRRGGDFVTLGTIIQVGTTVLTDVRVTGYVVGIADRSGFTRKDGEHVTILGIPQKDNIDKIVPIALNVTVGTVRDVVIIRLDGDHVLTMWTTPTFRTSLTFVVSLTFGSKVTLSMI
jgi:hypothetical protein